MGKSTKCKKSKVPKLTEAEYAAYISSLKTGEDAQSVPPGRAINVEKGLQKRVEN